MRNSLIALALCILIVGVLWFAFKREPEIPTDPIELVVDSIHHRMDTTLTIIDSSVVRVDYIQKQYEKTYITINNQSVTADMVFFSEYLSADDSRFIGNYNPDSVKAD